jgi:alkanesulfonate monooxygenase SsuD/methylene tetrahydromethanopterin reductase-like flavin-dependent oxidoreductase (luciferase family)
MRFGIFSVVDHYPRELSRTTARFYGELLEQVQAAEALGFESFWVAEHHFHEYGAIPRPPIWMAAAAQHTRRIRLGSAVVVLPFDNPLRSAEDYAMVDVLSGGRLNLGVGSGYLRHEFDGFGLAPEDKRARFDEALEILLRAWTGERFSYAGTFHRVRDVQLNILPLQQPRPPLWVAILNNASAAHLGARRLPIMMIPYATTERLSELAATVAAFRTAFVEAGGQPEDATVPFGLHTYCADSFEEARREAKEAMDRYVRTRLYAKQRPFELLVEKDLIAYGSPDDVIRVAQAYESAGLTHFLAIANFGGLAHDRVLRSMELLAKHVLPAFSAPGETVGR